MKNWQQKYPSYQGEQPYLYFAFADADAKKAWRVMRVLLRRGFRVWYCTGPAKDGAEVLKRQEMSAGASLILLYLTDATIRDTDLKSRLLANQKKGKPIICLDSDRSDNRLDMGIRETTPYLALPKYRSDAELDTALIQMKGVTQELIGEPVDVPDGTEEFLKKLTIGTVAAALILLAVSLFGVQYLSRLRPEKLEDSVQLSDQAILSAVREANGGGPITEESLSGITVLRIKAMPESWEDLELLPSLERLEIPQQFIAEAETLPEGYIIELTGGGAS